MKYMLIITSVLLLGACQSENKSTPMNTSQTPPKIEPSAPQPIKAMHLTGTLVYKNLEGGFYAFEADNGKHYTLRGLPKNLLQQGVRLNITAVPEKEQMSIQQYGTAVKVLSAEKIGQIKLPDDSL